MEEGKRERGKEKGNARRGDRERKEGMEGKREGEEGRRREINKQRRKKKT